VGVHWGGGARGGGMGWVHGGGGLRGWSLTACNAVCHGEMELTILYTNL
jgi:hypothetical protein